MDKAVAGEEHAVVERNMSSQKHPIRENDLVAQMAVVRHMGIGHEKTPRADHSFLLRLVRAMDGYMLAENIAVTNAHSGWLSGVFQVLRRFADHATGVEAVSRADRRQARQIRMRTDHTIRANLHAFVYDSVWPHLDRRGQFCLWVNDRSWMNHKTESRTTTPIAKSKGTCHDTPC